LLLLRHPWVLTLRLPAAWADADETVRVGAESVGASLFIARIAQTIWTRSRFDEKSDGARLGYLESGGLPVDRHADTLAAQLSSCGIERRKSVLVEARWAETGLTRR
jgi:23S rRNA G2069 N7-methylase RlmK/C1962 C5-methylase RlmI